MTLQEYDHFVTAQLPTCLLCRRRHRRHRRHRHRRHQHICLCLRRESVHFGAVVIIGRLASLHGVT